MAVPSQMGVLISAMRRYIRIIVDELKDTVSLGFSGAIGMCSQGISYPIALQAYKAAAVDPSSWAALSDRGNGWVVEECMPVDAGRVGLAV